MRCRVIADIYYSNAQLLQNTDDGKDHRRQHFRPAFRFKNAIFVRTCTRVCVCCELSGAATPDSGTFCSLETSMKKINLSADQYLSLKAWDLAPSHIITGPFGNKSSNALDFMYM